MYTKIANILGLASLASAIPAPKPESVATHRIHDARNVANISSVAAAAGFDCGNPVWGLNRDDCNWMSQIGIRGQGANPNGNNGNMWIGGDGPNRFNFMNKSPVDITVLVWNNQFISGTPPVISWSLPRGQQFTVSMVDGVSGGWSAIWDRRTIIKPESGQLKNTIGEFTTGRDGVFDISREIFMGGNKMDARVNGCVSDWDRCIYNCRYGADTCWLAGTYELYNCQGGSQPGAAGDYSRPDENGGGCRINGGTIDAGFY